MKRLLILSAVWNSDYDHELRELEFLPLHGDFVVMSVMSYIDDVDYVGDDS